MIAAAVKWLNAIEVTDRVHPHDLFKIGRMLRSNR